MESIKSDSSPSLRLLPASRAAAGLVRPGLMHRTVTCRAWCLVDEAFLSLSGSRATCDSLQDLPTHKYSRLRNRRSCRFVAQSRFDVSGNGRDTRPDWLRASLDKPRAPAEARESIRGSDGAKQALPRRSARRNDQRYPDARDGRSVCRWWKPSDETRTPLEANTKKIMVRLTLLFSRISLTDSSG